MTIQPEHLHSPAWHAALTLAERAALSAAASNGVDTTDREQAARLLQRWREQAPFSDADWLSRRLAQDGLDTAGFEALLGVPAADLQRYSSTPDWLKQLQRLFERSESAPAEAAGAGFLNLIRPLLDDARRRLQAGEAAIRERCPQAPWRAEVIMPQLWPSLTDALARALARTLVLELNVARVKGELAGDTPEARFNSFTGRLREPEYALAILEEYPVLARQLLLRIEQWLETSLEFLGRLAADWDMVCTRFSPATPPGQLTEISGGAGDPHCGGRSVLIARFESGFRIVYKPRSLAVDRHFQALLAWLNAHGAQPELPLLQLLDQGEYGWVEFIEPGTCEGPQQVQRFYQRQGSYLALLYALNATDFHSENLIACGEHPVLIDLEALFHPVFGKTDAVQAERDLATQYLRGSVLWVGLLPQRTLYSEESEGVDLSGLGSKQGQLTPDRLPYFESVGTDEMRLERRRQEMGDTPNRATLQGAELELGDYTEDLVAGFIRTYQLIADHRDELLSDTGPLAAFAADRVRVVLRATRSYALMLQESFHPDLLRDALRRDLFFDKLWLWVPTHPHLESAIPAELKDLWNGDIPFFTTLAGTRDLYDSRGTVMPQFLSRSGLELARERLRQLSREDLARQVWIIRSSVSTLQSGDAHAATVGTVAPAGDTATDPAALQQAACEIADRLLASACPGAEDVSWLSMTTIHGRHRVLAQTGVDFYDGVAGIGFFLAYLGRQTGEARYTDMARRCLASVRLQLQETADSLSCGFAGLGGLVYYFTHLAVLWDEPELLAEARTLAMRLRERIERDDQFDFLAGAAGAIAGLATLSRVETSAEVREILQRCALHLVEHTVAQPVGLAWPVPIPSHQPLTGFAHGVAGIAWALLEAHALTGETRFRETALAGIAYERSLFSTETRNWPELRDFTAIGLAGQQSGGMWAWCHGAPGIGLGRLAALCHHDDETTRGEIETVLNSTAKHGFGSSHCLCHGRSGNTELFLVTGQALNDSERIAQARELGGLLLADIRLRGYACGVPGGVETPGLMQGIAGIGYQLLRLAQPDTVPAVLIAEAPKQVPAAVQRYAQAR